MPFGPTTAAPISAPSASSTTASSTKPASISRNSKLTDCMVAQPPVRLNGAYNGDGNISVMCASTYFLYQLYEDGKYMILHVNSVASSAGMRRVTPHKGLLYCRHDVG